MTKYDDREPDDDVLFDTPQTLIDGDFRATLVDDGFADAKGSHDPLAEGGHITVGRDYLQSTDPQEPPPPSKPGKFAESHIRRYADGQLTSTRGDKAVPPSGAYDAVFEVPYTSSDVLLRLGEYDILKLLGKGGMGKVYLAYSLRLCRYCAIKVMQENAQLSEVKIFRFQNEAILAGRLRHPNIISVFDSGEQDGYYYFVMDCIDGGSLKDLIDDGSEEATRRGLQALAKVARALHFAHENGIIHRDIKPDNILFDRHGEPYITDFGIAKDHKQDFQLTSTSLSPGTPFYMAPEQANGELQSLGPWTDVYNAGSTLYHLLTGSVPFDGKTLVDLLTQVLYDEPPSPRERCRQHRGRELPLDLEVICLKALEKKADKRYESAAALADDIEAFLEGRPIAARPLTGKEKLQKKLERNRGLLVASAAVVGILMLMLVAFGATVIYNIQRTSESLRWVDRAAAIDQASTLERAIRTNMLEGRADIVRTLIHKLRTSPKLRSIDVVRADRSYAYTDLRTHKAVKKRLSNAKVVAWIRKRYPSIVPRIQDLRKRALPNIRKARKKRRIFPMSLHAWRDLLTEPKVQTRIEQLQGEKVLTVLWPIRNGKACQTCHGKVGAGYSYYGKANAIRAVLVVRRSLKSVEQKIRKNQRSTLLIGIGTTGVFLLLMLVFTQLFGVGLQPQTFGKTE